MEDAATSGRGQARKKFECSKSGKHMVLLDLTAPAKPALNGRARSRFQVAGDRLPRTYPRMRSVDLLKQLQASGLSRGLKEKAPFA
jgi:hypothetical protein